MENTKEKPKVVSTAKACDMLGCSRTTFYNKYKRRLTAFTDKSQWQCLYLLSEVEELVKNLEAPEVLTDFELIE